MRKRIIFAISTVLLLFLVIILIRGRREESNVTVDVERVGRKTIIETIPANGSIEPVSDVKISPDVSGEIIELNVKGGSHVKRGDIILKIKQDTYLSAVEQETATLNSLRSTYLQQQAQYTLAEQSYRRNKRLYELRTISLQEYESACANWEVAQHQLDAAKFNVTCAEAKVKEARENLEKTTIYAPMDGIVSKLNVELGERVVGTSQMAGTEILRIVDFSEMEVIVYVNENDIVNISLGDSAKITVDAYPGRKFDGRVTKISNASSSESLSADQATTFQVKVRILPESYTDLQEKREIPFLTGMSASVQITTRKAENVLAVPLSCVTTRSDLFDDISTEVREAVFVYDEQTHEVHPRVITCALQDINDIEVTSGLSESTLVVTAPFVAISKTLKDGTKVKAHIIN